MNKIRKKLNDIVREEGNKLSPDFLTGVLSKKKYGLGDVLTYNLGYRHLGTAMGASVPVLLWMHGTGYNISNAVFGAIVNLPFEAVGGFFGYIAGISIDAFHKPYKKEL